MSRRLCRKHLPRFIANVALDAIRCDKTLSELAKQRDAHMSGIADGKDQLLEHYARVFGRDTWSEPKTYLKELCARTSLHVVGLSRTTPRAVSQTLAHVEQRPVLMSRLEKVPVHLTASAHGCWCGCTVV